MENKVNDPINPNHYKGESGLEVIEVIRDWTKPLHGLYAVGVSQMLKYILRAHKKNGLEDIKKAGWWAYELTKIHLPLYRDDRYISTRIDMQSVCKEFINDQKPLLQVIVCLIHDLVETNSVHQTGEKMKLILFAIERYIQSEEEENNEN